MNNEMQCVPVTDFTQPLIRLYQESMVSSVALLCIFTVLLYPLLSL
jgi:hypothetical protein